MSILKVPEDLQMIVKDLLDREKSLKIIIKKKENLPGLLKGKRELQTLDRKVLGI